MWDEIHKYVLVHTDVKSRQLHSKLNSITKCEKSIYEYLARVQRIIDILESIDDPVSHRDQLEVILEGFPDEFNVLASIIQYRATLCPIVKAQSMHLDHEAKLEKSKKSTLTRPMSVNIMQTTSAPPQVVFQIQNNPSQGVPFKYAIIILLFNVLCFSIGML